MPHRHFAAAFAALILGGCAADPQLRLPVPTVPTAARVPISVGSVEVREVSLPLYAGQETVFLETAGGAVVGSELVLWADDPTRAFTEGLAVALAAMTRARVAAEPWPFFENPAARVEVRMTRALAGSDGQFRISGQYFVASGDGTRRDVARRFDIAVPYDGANQGSIGAAKGRAIDALARRIASDGL